MIQITGINKNFDVVVDLVGSKSESNRALMIGYYGGFKPRIKNLSESDDTKLLKEIINSFSYPSYPKKIDCANAGTVLRFLATVLAVRDGEHVLTGSDRMQQRPVGDLVDTLRKIGADIEYIGQEGFPPLRIHGKNIVETHGRASLPIHIDITRSSQFASSLLLATPIVQTCYGVSLHLDGDLSSLPYIDMTIDVMRKFGVKVHRDGRDIFLEPSDYQDVEYIVESDWTCASYWYEIVALSENGRARLRNLHLDSKQGDAIVANWFENFGVKSIQDGDDVVIEHVEAPETSQNRRNCVYTFDFINNPDLYPTIAATCAGLQVEGRFTGLRNLIHKESDRVAAMTTELSRIEMSRHETSAIVFDSHNDHRIAMALAPLAMKIGAIEINNAEVVSKSYPGFWDEFQKIIPSR
ncbi:MAG: 3-phosphoshikimate 1-carboxyvinyltransferase [Bacteroidales bacterium]|nr:3-phosphoshikimate 1-carboxyvinyltransferase [Bacteroidales bacterium]